MKADLWQTPLQWHLPSLKPDPFTAT